MGLFLYILVINAFTYWLYWLDKRASIRGSRRVPEATLLAAGFAGGTPGAIFAQQKLRHKTKKLSFRVRFWGLTAVQIAILLFQPQLLSELLRRLGG